MFKSIQWKVLTVFVLLIISVMIVVGTFLLNNISGYYHNEFKNQMENNVFTQDFVSQMRRAAGHEHSIDEMSDILGAFAIRMGIDSFRKCYILNARTTAVYYDLDGGSDADIDITQNLLTAMAGGVGNAINPGAPIMDYAYPVSSGDGPEYIIYVSDTKEELFDLLGSIFTIILWALLLGIIISVLLGLILSRTIIAPIATLTKRAQRIASGDFEHKIEENSRDELGQLTMAFNKMATDLSETLDDIAREKNKVETIFLFMSDGIIAFDRDGSVLHINPAAKKMLGIEDANMSFDIFFKALNVDITLASILYLDHYKTIERSFHSGDRHLKAFFAPFMVDEGETNGVVVVFQDITEQEKLETSRREFVANVSHELRTPLTTVKSYTETLLESMDAKSMEANFLEVINNEADRMARIVKDLLTLSRLDYEKASLNKTTFSLSRLVSEVVKKLSIDAANHNHELVIKKLNDLPPFYGDRDRIEQVITNIVSNAIKYTADGGKIHVEYGYQFTEAVITVTDTGIGIPPSDISRIFERFYRVDKARSRKFGGTGLGLAIAREIIDAHGGTIDIKSRQGRGTTVTIKIPVYSE